MKAAEVEESTIAFYEKRADVFEAATSSADLSHLYDRFLSHLPVGARILDAGCGTGRDALAFANRGFKVAAFDASSEMVRRSQIRLGALGRVHELRFEDVKWRSEFDGVWACASLLHVPDTRFVAVAERLIETLRPRGIWYASFKLGSGSRRDGERFFVDHTESSLRSAFGKLPVVVLDLWETKDARPSRPQGQWLNIVVRRS